MEGNGPIFREGGQRPKFHFCLGMKDPFCTK